MTTVPTASTRIPFGRGLRAGAIGGGLAAALNLALFLVAQAVGGPLEVQPPNTPTPETLEALPVMLFSFVPGVVAGLIYAGLGRVSAQPWRWLLVLAAAVFIGMGVLPFSATHDALTLWTLQGMHVLAAGAILWALRRYARP
jgi:hypothetical protein